MEFEFCMQYKTLLYFKTIAYLTKCRTAFLYYSCIDAKKIRFERKECTTTTQQRDNLNSRLRDCMLYPVFAPQKSARIHLTATHTYGKTSKTPSGFPKLRCNFSLPNHGKNHVFSGSDLLYKVAVRRSRYVAITISWLKLQGRLNDGKIRQLV